MTPKHVIIEAVYKQVALACECNWRHLCKIREGKIMLAYVLTCYISREESTDIYGVTESTFLGYYLSPANKLLRIDEGFKQKVYNVKRAINKNLLDYKLMNQNSVLN